MVHPNKEAAKRTCHCGARAKAKGLCPKHYQAAERLTPEGKELRRQRAVEYRRALGPVYKERHRRYLREWARGWTPAQEAAARSAQGGLCAICARLMTAGRGHDGECADHYEDDTGKHARALLCSTCNKSLGGYERRQRPAGLIIPVYEQYLARYDDRYGTETRHEN
jgi:hypothetical protein